MSAKDRRKATSIPLSAELVGRLRAYARANGERSLSAAARRALRASLEIGRDVAAPRRRAPSSRDRARILRLQLERELSCRLIAAGVQPDRPDALLAMIVRRLEVTPNAVGGDPSPQAR